ncbi:putative spermidine/putrescine transport system substrate-binding protein [Halovenus aranensis]|uniref:Putative spermidine/putrescine transport system substrate-binding protein n=1 Tax=Halovenus aranensis TaxID=890420 RepID=A0A1G8YHK4_9EURY|nr:extracellular solute-binding protein [Halovenus aranensis]SDK01685.1 putative spermidine/putrescine transport system substrate-binding protein [Halovenus aranensis]
MSQDNATDASGSLTDSVSRRRFLVANGTAATAALAGCLGGDDGDDGGDTTDGAETVRVGYGEYETTINTGDLPDELFIYAVQTGWSNWDAVMDAFEEEYGVSLFDDQRTSGEALTNIRTNHPNHEYGAYNGAYSVGLEAWDEGFTTDYKPKGYESVPDEFKTDDGHVTATRQMTVAINYRKDIYEERGLDEPETWEDLKQPEIAQDLAINVPGAGSGLNAMLSINHAYGGDLDNLDPLFEYFEDIAEHGAEHRRNLDQQFTAGEISTYAEYDFGGLSTKYNSDDIPEEDVGVVIPKGPDGGEGATQVPYGYAMLQDPPNEDAAKLFMDFVLSPDVQELFFDGFVRPIRASEDSVEAPDEFPAAEQYGDAAFGIDQAKLLDKQQGIIEEILERSPLPGVEA